VILSGDLLGERARLTPGRTALVYIPTGERFTYADLDARARAWARVLREVLGVERDGRVALLADNRVEYLDAFFAAPKAGVVLVPLGTRLTPRELAVILEDAAPTVLIYGGEHAGTVRALRELVSLPVWVALDADQKVDPADPSLADLLAQLETVPDSPWTPERRGPEDLHRLL